MKVTVKITFRARQFGMGVLALRITRHRVTRTIMTPYEISFDEWDETHQKIVFTGSSAKRKKELGVINGKLKGEMQLIFKAIETLEVCGDYCSQDVVAFYREQQRGLLLCECISNRVADLKEAGKFGTAHAYEYAAISFRKFLDGKDVSIHKISGEMIEKYESYLKEEKLKDNTLSCYMRTLRANYNHAVKKNFFTLEDTQSKPFAGVFTGYAKTPKRAIDSNNICRLVEVNPMNMLSPHSSEKDCADQSVNSLSFVRDLFLFSLYTQGMNFSDMANLKKKNIRDGAIVYVRKKTGQTISIELEACMKEIIDRYSDNNSGFIFPILREYENCDEFTRWKQTKAALAIFNKKLNKLALLAGVKKHITSYVARHSWASLASQEGVPISTISKGMGHESEKTTQIYISRLDLSDVAQANRKILSRLTKKIVFTPFDISRGSYVGYV